MTFGGFGGFGGFGASSSSSSGFGGFGGFGASSSSSAFGGFGGFGQSSSSSAFGGFGGFGASSSSSSSNPFGGGFGGGFGGFGQSSSSSAFGGFGQSSSSSAFGGFGGFGQSSSSSAFGGGFGFGQQGNNQQMQQMQQQMQQAQNELNQAKQFLQQQHSQMQQKDKEMVFLLEKVVEKMREQQGLSAPLLSRVQNNVVPELADVPIALPEWMRIDGSKRLIRSGTSKVVKDGKGGGVLSKLPLSTSDLKVQGVRNATKELSSTTGKGGAWGSRLGVSRPRGRRQKKVDDQEEGWWYRLQAAKNAHSGENEYFSQLAALAGDSEDLRMSSSWTAGPEATEWKEPTAPSTEPRSEQQLRQDVEQMIQAGGCFGSKNPTPYQAANERELGHKPLAPGVLWADTAHSACERDFQERMDQFNCDAHCEATLGRTTRPNQFRFRQRGDL